MTDELRERIEAMEALIAKGRKHNQSFVGVGIVSLSALIAEVERLAAENATLKDFIVEHHGTEPPIVAAIEDAD